MPERTIPFSLDQIGTGAVRFPSGAPIPSISDAAVDPYALTRISKEIHVEGIMFWPQVKESFPGLVLLHEWWGLNEQIKDVARQLAGEGYVVLVPNLYGRQGGMITANTELADILMSRTKDQELLQDINSCCELLNTRDHVKRNTHGVIGFGMGGSLAIPFGSHRRRLKAAVSYYGRMSSPGDTFKNLYCPLLYHQAADDDWVPAEDVDRLRQLAKEHGKTVDIRTYAGARHAFCNQTLKDSYHPEAARTSWEATVEFLATCFKGL